MRISILDLKMTNSRLAKIASISAGVAMTLGFASTAGAATTAELQAQINQLMAQLTAMQGNVSTTFTVNLTVGSRGPQVVALQSFLESKGYLVMPVGVSKGYFGGLTRAAVARFQAANQITPAVGYFGPITRGVVNAMLMTSGTGTPVGGTTTGGTVGGTTTGSTSGTIMTPGVEGTMTVNLASNPSSGQTVREGQIKAPLIGLEIQANTSDIKVQRVKIDLGTNSTIYTKKFTKVYLTDPSGNVLASSDLNSSTVVKDVNNYYITLSGFGYVVPKDAKRILTVKADVYSAVNSTYQVATTVTVPVNGVRGIDGAGIDQYGPATAFSNSVTIGGSLADSATFQLSTNANTVKSTDVVANGGTNNNEADMVTLGSFDVFAQKDNVLFTDLNVTVSKTGLGTATATTAYLFDGSNQIASASINATTGVASFTNFDLSVAKDTTKTLTVKVDIRSANATAANFTLTVAAGGVSAENSQGSSITATGSATGNVIVVRSIGPVFTLLSKSITKSSTAPQNNTSTSTLSATFNVQVKAVGGDILFGTQASTNPMFVFGLYQGSTLTTLVVASSSNITLPSSGVVVDNANNSFTLQQNNTVTLPVNVLVEGRTTAGALVTTANYAVGLQQINWISQGVIRTSTYMAGQTDWRTDYVALP